MQKGPISMFCILLLIVYSISSIGLCQTTIYDNATGSSASTESTTDVRSDYIPGNSSVIINYSFASGTTSDEHTNVTADYVTTSEALVKLKKNETTLLCYILKSKDFYSSYPQDTISFKDTVIFTDIAGNMSQWIQMIGCYTNITLNEQFAFNLTSSRDLEDCRRNCQRFHMTDLPYFGLQDQKCYCISKEFNRTNPHDAPHLCKDGKRLCCASTVYTVLVYYIGPRSASGNSAIDLTDSFACDNLQGVIRKLEERANTCVSLTMRNGNDYRISCNESLVILCTETAKLVCPTISPVDKGKLNESKGFCSIYTCIFPIVCGYVGVVLFIAVTCCLRRVKFRDKPKRIILHELNNTDTEEEVQLNILSTLPSTNSRYSFARPGNTVTEEEIQFNTRNTLPSTSSRYSLARPGNTVTEEEIQFNTRNTLPSTSSRYCPHCEVNRRYS